MTDKPKGHPSTWEAEAAYLREENKRLRKQAELDGDLNGGVEGWWILPSAIASLFVWGVFLWWAFNVVRWAFGCSA